VTDARFFQEHVETVEESVSTPDARFFQEHVETVEESVSTPDARFFNLIIEVVEPMPKPITWAWATGGPAWQYLW
jgi:hypothetical protein